MINDVLHQQIRDKFAYINTCPYEKGKRIFFENAGGALTLKSVVATSQYYAGLPDNQGRDNAASHALGKIIDDAKAAMRVWMNAPNGQFFVGESGTELLFRLIMNACLGNEKGTTVLGSTLEHPATRSACARWSKIADQRHVLISHDDDMGLVRADAYAQAVTPDTVVATIIHTSPVTGMAVDIVACAKAIRAVAPECYIIVDGIQHAAHGHIDINLYDIDGYVISPYKVFSRHGYGLAWISDRLSDLAHDYLMGAPHDKWELGTRDTGAYATFHDVIAYFDWLDKQSGDARHAIHAHEKYLTDSMINGMGNLRGLRDCNHIHIIGGQDNPAREGLVAFTHDDMCAEVIVKQLNHAGIRTHTRKNDYYSNNILSPLNLDNCVRVSMCHYNNIDEVKEFLHVIGKILR